MMRYFPMNSAALLAAACLALGSLVAAPVAAQGSSVTLAQRDALDVVFTTVERRVIEDYFGIEPPERTSFKGKHKGKGKGRQKGLPPGLAKRGSLPPGLAKRKTLPPGLDKRQLPPGLSGRLGPPPHGTERFVVDTNVLLVETATGIVLDILEDVIRGN